jgi:conjugal transfer/entry exclusion protein
MLKKFVFSAAAVAFLMCAHMQSAWAWDVVFDPSNYVQTSTTAGAAVKSEAYQDTNIAYQYQMMLNQLKQATNLDPAAMAAQYNQITSDLKATTNYVNTLTSLYGQIQSDAQYMTRVEALVSQSGKTPTQWLSDTNMLIQSGDSMAKQLFQQGNDVMSHIQTLATRRQQIQAQLGLSPTQQATAELTTHMLDIVASQNQDMLQMMAMKQQSAATASAASNADALAKNSAQQLLQAQYDNERSALSSRVFTGVMPGQ